MKANGEGRNENTYEALIDSSTINWFSCSELLGDRESTPSYWLRALVRVVIFSQFNFFSGHARKYTIFFVFGGMWPPIDWFRMIYISVQLFIKIYWMCSWRDAGAHKWRTTPKHKPINFWILSDGKLEAHVWRLQLCFQHFLSLVIIHESGWCLRFYC